MTLDFGSLESLDRRIGGLGILTTVVNYHPFHSVPLLPTNDIVKGRGGR